MKRKLFIVITVVLCLTVMAGCGGNTKVDAELYDNVEEWINEDFAAANRTRGAFYGDDLPTDSTFPKSITFIVDNESEYAQIFNDACDMEIDFENEMLIVHTFTTVYHRTLSLTAITKNDGVMKITYTMESKTDVGDASRPYQRWIVIKLDKTDITAVEIEEKV